MLDQRLPPRACECHRSGKLGPKPSGHVVVPEPQDTFVTGQAVGFVGGAVRLYTNGAKGPDVDATVEANGAFAHTLPGTFGAAGVVLWIESGADVAMAVVPEVLPAQSIFHESRVVRLVDQHPLLSDVNSLTTAATLMLFAIAREQSLLLGDRHFRIVPV